DNFDHYLDLASTKIGSEVLVTFTDYTQLKQTQLQLEKNVEDLKRSNAILEEFAHAASHDLKEPVRKVQVFSDRLKRSLSTLSDEQSFLFTRVEDATRRMSLLIEDLLDYSHVSMGIDMVEAVDLNEKLNTVISDLEVAIQDKGAVVEVGHLPVVSGHRRQLQQLFHNLLQNALKYSKASEVPRISITSQKVSGLHEGAKAAPEGNHISYHLVQVKDNGIGFEQAYAEQIFKMFQRLHGKSEYSGSGVGLAIVRKVVENHNGYIEAEGRPGEGATFKIWLPANNL
ncbi:MAG: sensor histidine kinase, partial [Chitinophagaceae bacterium]